MKTQVQSRTRAALVATLAIAMSAVAATGADRQSMEREAEASLQQLYATNSAAKLLGANAAGILVFPTIVKAGFMFGGQIGDGVLLKNGKMTGHYNSIAASYGLQAGIQKFGYVLFFMNDGALRFLDQSNGFEIGVGPSVVIVDEGMGKSITSTTISQDVYAFIFDQRGLMGGIGVQGSKITRIAD